MAQPLHIAIPWYDRDRYARVRAVMADGNLLPVDFDEWLHKAEAVFLSQIAQGRSPHRIDIDPDEFLGWCTARNVDADAKARLTYSQDVMVRQIRRT